MDSAPRAHIDSKQVLVDSVLEWARNELRVPAQGGIVPTADELRLICRGAFAMHMVVAAQSF